MVSPTVYVRRSLAQLMCDMPQQAFEDAMQAQVISPTWPIASYLQAAALFAMGKENEALTALKDGSALETNTRGSTWGPPQVRISAYCWNSIQLWSPNVRLSKRNCTCCCILLHWCGGLDLGALGTSPSCILELTRKVEGAYTVPFPQGDSIVVGLHQI